MAVRALLAVSWLLFALPAAAQEKRTSLTEEDLERAKALDAEFRTLLGSEKPEVCAQLEEARVRILDKDSRWDYLKGFRTLRSLRSRAAVPLLIEMLILRHEDPTCRRQTANALTVLTGRPTPDLWLADIDSVADLAKEFHEWWGRGKDTFTTDFEKMTEAQIEGVVARVVQLDADLDRAGGGIPHMGAYDEDLSARMVPALLETMRDRERRAAAGRLLGRLHALTGGKELEAIARDPKQKGELRLGALLALKSAGEPLRATPLVEILDAALEASRVEALDPAKASDLKADAIAALADVCAEDIPAAQERILALLEEADPAIRVAALRALAKFAPAAETTRMRKRLFAAADVDEARATLEVLRKIASPDSVEALAEYLRSVLPQSPFHDSVRVDALSAFGLATGNRWLEAGPHPEVYYFEQAKKAVSWWDEEKKSKK